MTALSSRNPLLAGAAIVALVIAWRVLVTGFDAWHQAAIATDPEQVRASVDGTASEQAWRQRLAHNPADIGALLVLALELDRTGRRDEAGAAMRQAIRLAPADPQVLAESANFFLRTGDDVRALAILRRMADFYPAARKDVWPALSAVLESGRGNEFFLGVARDNPSWWPAFFEFACAATGDPVRLQQIVLVRVEGRVVTPDERRCLVGRLQKEGRWDTAYQVWLNTLPSEQRHPIGYVFNGAFELPLSNLGFDWMAPKQDGVDVDTDKIEGVAGGRALRVTYDNKPYAGPPVFQYTMLHPGAYRLEGRGRPAGLDTYLGLQWGLYCRDAPGREPRQLMRTERYLGSAEWALIGQDFVVPGDCPVQVLRLELANPRRDAPAPANTSVRLRGSVWFDDLRIRAVDYAQKKAVARLTGMQGAVLVSQADGMAVAGPDARVAAGVRVVTMAGAKVTVSYDAGCNVKLEENMRFVVREGGACAALIASVESLVPPVRAAGGAGTAAGPGRSVTPSPMVAAAATAPALAYGIYVAHRNASNVSPD